MIHMMDLGDALLWGSRLKFMGRRRSACKGASSQPSVALKITSLIPPLPTGKEVQLPNPTALPHVETRKPGCPKP